MPVFESPAQLETAAYHLFERLKEEHAQATNRVVGARLLVLLKSTDPDAQVWLDGRRPPLEIGFGPARMRPDLEVALKGDTLHEILSGDLSLLSAFKGGQVQVYGPIWRAAVLGELFDRAQDVYGDALLQAGVTP